MNIRINIYTILILVRDDDMVLFSIFGIRIRGGEIIDGFV